MSIKQSVNGAITCTGEGVAVFQLLAVRGAFLADDTLPEWVTL